MERKKKVVMIMTVTVMALAAVIIGGLVLSFNYPLNNDNNNPDIPATKCVLSIKVLGNGTTSPIPGDYELEKGETMSIVAMPGIDSFFSGWTGSIDGNERIIFVTVNTNGEITANFKKVPTTNYSLTINVNGQGTTDPVQGIHKYVEGTEVNITATSLPGSLFKGWSGDINSTERSISTTMNADKTVTANFVELYSLTILIDGMGTTNMGNGTYIFEKGTELTLEAIPYGFNRFDHWSGDVTGNESLTSIIMHSNMNVTAHFIETTQYSLTIVVYGEGTTDPLPGVYTFSEGEEITITAIEDQSVDWYFDCWTNGISRIHHRSMTFTMDSNVTLVACFAERGVPQYYLTIEVIGDGTTNPPHGFYTFSEGLRITITAIPSRGWELKYWDWGWGQEEEESVTFIIDSDITIIARFWYVGT